MSEAVTVWYLEMREASQLNASANPGGISVAEARVKQWPVNRFFYEYVGGPWQWTDKLSWSDEQWRDYAEADSLRTWLAWVDGSPAGYFELGRLADGAVEICYFGLAEPFLGKGFGGYLLSEAIGEAWAWEASRVIVNTCSLDGPAALANYQARGMRIYRTESG